jgi:glycosyltransferase involved in cell wall biosynthesis
VVVVFVTHNYPRQAGDLPGSFLHPLAMALRDRGHDVRVVAPADQGASGRDLLDGILVNRVRYSVPEFEDLAYEGMMQQRARSVSGFTALLGLLLALKAGARAEARDAKVPVVFHGHWWFPGGLSLPGGSKVARLVTLHGTDGRLLESSVPGRWLGRRVLRRARVVTAVSTELATLAEQVSGRKDITSHVQPMPVASTERPWSSGGGGAYVIARLVPQKRIELAVAAIGELAKTGEPLALTIVGSGPELARLEALATALPAPAKVHFTGQLGQDEVAQRLSTADVMLFPAVREGLGLSAIEALMAGVPVIACRDGGGVVSALGKHGGGVIAEPNPHALATALRNLAANDQKDAARSAGARWREELAPARVAERFEGWYREALGA